MRPLAGASTTAVDDFLEKSAIGTTEVVRRATAAALEEEPAVEAMEEERIAIEMEKRKRKEKKDEGECVGERQRKVVSAWRNFRLAFSRALHFSFEKAFFAPRPPLIASLSPKSSSSMPALSALRAASSRVAPARATASARTSRPAAPLAAPSMR